MLNLQVSGNIGRDAEIKEVSSKKMIVFTVACNETYKKDDQTVEKTTWVNCTIFVKDGGSLKVAEIIKKGCKIYVEGRPEVKSYKDSEGVTQHSLNLRVNKQEVLTFAKEE